MKPKSCNDEWNMYKNLLMLRSLIDMWTCVNKALPEFQWRYRWCNKTNSIMIGASLFTFVGRSGVKSIGHQTVHLCLWNTDKCFVLAFLVFTLKGHICCLEHNYLHIKLDYVYKTERHGFPDCRSDRLLSNQC